MSEVAVITRRSARKAKGDGHLRRAEILDAAERIFVAEGYEGATIRKIADEVGVSSTALYMHFKDKSCILHEICERTMQQLLDRNTEIAGRSADARVRLRAMLEAYMLWGFEHPNAYLLVFGGGRPVSAVQHIGTTGLGAQCYEIFCRVVGELGEAGRLKKGDTEAVAQALWAACHGMVALVVSRPEVKWAPRDELLALTLDGLLDGLAPA
ncbi:TetR/AcrR family transcriptional regulator [Phenylobacterium terrae]|uniref:TetR/AcrR family transcriptional regulator n=1 Tax=Phenylobacterium terrae TaxID=2665495 RepID=A0ABW4N3V5_9CAUL